ncbi:calmodulin-binding protein 25 [Cucumis melo]|uniref:Calmodulin-binding protein 25 n=1 Tax=Cucumis melo TaxID=3656 RepID=A0A1S3B7H6_CUCME|nr:calmodulin-binding protein 25 [Cucumis melo]
MYCNTIGNTEPKRKRKKKRNADACSLLKQRVFSLPSLPPYLFSFFHFPLSSSSLHSSFFFNLPIPIHLWLPPTIFPPFLTLGPSVPPSKTYGFPILSPAKLNPSPELFNLPFSPPPIIIPTPPSSTSSPPIPTTPLPPFQVSPPVPLPSSTPPPPAPSSSKRHRSTIPPTAGKVSKRKSRASKNHTTFITADPANFRQMVQQVTGVRFGNSQIQIPPILKPEPQRVSARFAVCGGDGLPTLDTSAFLLNNNQQQQQSSGSGSEITQPGPVSFGSELELPNHGPIGSDFDTFSSFPTLESWKAVI